ncbi:single-stranded-DNA-specific exonuclease RecJ [Dongia rigui]|uniref:Single-stranded-DNA-specific exonuclease RecJ n=1 Tax=Dongia rigui TaxID=940149 RepID=A0ABU5E5Y1_9PROT|nr:single-stranded-DNA-specific exonuclease RecJ [Dongia rigui]MDY0874477.1 single-stranded-DNA-specific exonuclease RecJ [Dongia rigui]
MTTTEAFLGVARSACGRLWRQRPYDDRLGLAIAQREGVPELIGQLLASRGQTIDSAAAYLTPRLRDQMPDPSLFRDMDKAATRIADAIAGNEQMAIFGDYDVDGATSSALLLRFFAAVGAKAPILYVPDRLTEGYGPNAPAMRKLSDAGAKLVITVDCGITAFEPLAAAKDAGLDVVVVDHHVAEPRLPVAHAVVNPNRLDEAPGYGQLAAVGVAFLVVVATNRVLRTRGYYTDSRIEPDLMQWLDIVALGTVADVVPLTGINRALVAQGLKVMGGRQNIGLNALSDVARINERPSAYHAGFLLGPRVNAGGRVGRSDLGARLLSSNDAEFAREIAAELDALNTERRDIETRVLDAAIMTAEAHAAESPYLIFACGENWHPGVIGIVAGRLKERYQRPACVVAVENGIGKGSGRSVGNLHLGNAIIAAREAGILTKGGGHAMAAGFEVDQARLRDLQTFLQQRFDTDMKGEALMPVLDIDAALQPRGATTDLLNMLERMGPFGAGNAEPRFVFPNVRLAFADVVGGAHLRLQLEGADGARLKAIAFRCLDTELGARLTSARGMRLHLAGHLRRDTWQGRDNVQLIVEDAALAG